MGSAVGSAYSRRERLAQRAMEAGFDVPGFKLVRGRSVRKLREDMNEPKLAAAILKGGFVKDKAKLYTKPELISGPQAEKLVEKQRRAEFEKKFLFKPEPKLTVAAEDDPRDRVECSDFEDDGF